MPSCNRVPPLRSTVTSGVRLSAASAQASANVWASCSPKLPPWTAKFHSTTIAFRTSYERRSTLTALGWRSGSIARYSPSMQPAPIRVVIAKPGLDGHDRGAKVVARPLRDAGMEVVYTGLHQTPEQIVETALQEDARAIGLSILSGAHMTLFARLMELLKERDATDIVVFGGGIIPDADIAPLKELGVAEVFTPGTTTTTIVDWVRSHVLPADAA